MSLNIPHVSNYPIDNPLHIKFWCISKILIHIRDIYRILESLTTSFYIFFTWAFMNIAALNDSWWSLAFIPTMISFYFCSSCIGSNATSTLLGAFSNLPFIPLAINFERRKEIVMPGVESSSSMFYSLKICLYLGILECYILQIQSVLRSKFHHALQPQTYFECWFGFQFRMSLSSLLPPIPPTHNESL